MRVLGKEVFRRTLKGFCVEVEEEEEELSRYPAGAEREQ